MHFSEPLSCNHMDQYRPKAKGSWSLHSWGFGTSESAAVCMDSVVLRDCPLKEPNTRDKWFSTQSTLEPWVVNHCPQVLQDLTSQKSTKFVMYKNWTPSCSNGALTSSTANRKNYETTFEVQLSTPQAHISMIQDNPWNQCIPAESDLIPDISKTQGFHKLFSHI